MTLIMPRSACAGRRTARGSGALALGLLAALVAPQARAGEPKEDEGAGPEDVARDARTRFVPVRLTLRKDEGDYPDGYCTGRSDVTERKPTWAAGVLWDRRTVLVPDLCVPSRFVESVAVVADGEETPARYESFMRRARLAFVRLERPLRARAPVEFARAPEDAFAELWGASMRWDRPGWRLSVDGIGGGRAAVSGLPEPEFVFRDGPGEALVYDEDGRPVGFAASSHVVISERGPAPWRGSELRREAVVTMDELERRAEELKTRLARSVLEVRLIFRREEKGDGMSRFSSRHYFRGDDVRDESSNEWHGTGFLIGGGRVLVAADLARDPVIRIERMEVSSGGSWLPCRFVGAMRCLGALVLELEEGELPGALDLSRAAGFRSDELFLSAVVDHATGKRRVRVSHDRHSRWYEAYRGRLVACTYRDTKEGTAAFSLEGRLMGLAVWERREPGEEYSPDFEGPHLLRAEDIAKLLAAEDAYDPALKPLPKKEEKRIIWLGVETQKLTPDLARASKAEVQTHAGRMGLLVRHVYAGSPAERLGLRAWDILLRIEAEGQAPTDLQDEGYRDFMMGGYFGLMDDIPEEYRAQMLLRMPAPWPSRRTYLTLKLLTRLGEGRHVRLVYLRDGEQLEAELDLERAPADFQSAEKFKSEELGLTVSELTYEVRHYFRLTDDDTALLIAGVEPGGKAALGKLYPYVLLRRVNGAPAGSVAQFKELLDEVGAAEGEKKVLEVTIERFGKTRLVKIGL